MNTDRNNVRIYQQALNFVRGIIDENRRLEIVATHFKAYESELPSLQQFTLSLKIWIKDPNGMLVDERKNISNEGRLC